MSTVNTPGGDRTGLSPAVTAALVAAALLIVGALAYFFLMPKPAPTVKAPPAGSQPPGYPGVTVSGYPNSTTGNRGTGTPPGPAQSPVPAQPAPGQGAPAQGR